MKVQQILYLVKAISSEGRNVKRHFVEECPKIVTDIQGADEFVEGKIAELMNLHNWSMVLDWEVINMGENLTIPKKPKKTKDSNPEIKSVDVADPEIGCKGVQGQINEYFKNTSTRVLYLFTECFVYHVKNESVKPMLDTFIKENGLEKAWEHYIYDFIDKKSVYLGKTSLSEKGVLDEIKQSLLNLCYFRMKKLI